MPLKRDLKKLNIFHHRCIKAVLKITSLQQLEERLSSAQVRECWSDRDTIDTIMMRRRMEWLGHLARISNDHLPKMCLFDWLHKTRASGGLRRRWRDVVWKDLKHLGISESDWYGAAQNRVDWRRRWSAAISE